MIADIIHDFDSHLKSGHVYLVEVQLPLKDAPDDVPSSISYDVYLIANSGTQAHYIANTMYPDAVSYSWSEDPITEYAYAARRNRSIL